MKIQLFTRKDGSSLDYVGNSIHKCLMQYNNSSPVNLKTINKYIEGENIEQADVAICYGLISDMKYLKKNYSTRIAGLVCEKDLTEEEVQYIKEINPTEIWLPSEYCIKLFQKAGIYNLALMPHGTWNVNQVKLKTEPTYKLLMLFNSYPELNFHVKRKGILETIEAFRKFPCLQLHLRTTKKSYYNDLPSNVHFIEQRVDDLASLFNDYDAIISPSYSEGYGLIGLDALCIGVPLISTKTGNEYLTNDINYIDIELPVSPTKIINAITEFYQNYKHYTRKALEQTKQVIEGNHWLNVDKVIQKRLNSLYQHRYK